MLQWHRYAHPERIAYAMWSALAEGTLAEAHRLIGLHGPVEALDIVAAWADRGAHPTFTAAVERWAHRRLRIDIDALIDRHLSYGGFLLAPGDAGYRDRFADLGEQAPLALWARGKNFSALVSSVPPVAMVGARAASAYGVHVASDLAAELGALGHTIVSGGAYGIDAAAHRGALAAGGTTLAILAGGPDRFYPAGNTVLLRAIEERGLIVSEHPPGRQPSRFRFLERNRLIAAAGAATVVVQAALRSGALRTARVAAELGRPVGAIPGAVTDMCSAGCHEAIRGGLAVLVTDADDIRELAQPIGTVDTHRESPSLALLDGLAPEQARVLDALPKRAAAQLPMIADLAGLSVSEARSALGFLQLAGKVTVHGDAYRRAGI